MNGKKRNAYRVLVEKLKGKSLQRRPRRRRVDNIDTDLVDVGRGSVDWIDLAQAFMNTEMNL
jgi:hypothetical protein